MSGIPASLLRSFCPSVVAVIATMFLAIGGGCPAWSLPQGKLVDSLGRQVDLRVLLAQSRPTIVSFTYLGCRTICPTSDLVMDQVDSLMDLGADDVQLVTLTIDPANDTPPLLRKRALELGSTDRRVWLTGELPQVYRALDDLGIQFGKVEEHDALFVIFRSGGRVVQRVNGIPDPALLLKAARSR